MREMLHFQAVVIRDTLKKMILEIVIACVSFVLYWFLVALRPPPKYPPGPRFSTLPFVGNALIVGKSFAECYNRLRAKYGDVFSMYYGPYRTVVVCDYDLLQEVGASADLVYRPQQYLLFQLQGGSVTIGGVESCGGIIFGNGQSWAEQRRFTLHNLRNLGFGKFSMEDLVMEEVVKLNNHLECFNGEPISAKRFFNMAVINSLWHIVAGSKLEYDDEKLHKIIDFVDDLTKEKGGPFTMMVFYYKLFAQIVLKLNMVKSVKAFKNVFAFISSIIEEHKNTFQEDNPRDFIDVYIKEMQDQGSRQNVNSSFVGKIGDINFLNVIMDLFTAGSETTSNSLNHAMLLLLQNPDVLNRLQEELDEVTGRSRLPTYSDRDNTPYTEAVITEVQRMANLLPIVNHLAARDTFIGGGKYFIPEGTRVSMNLGCVLTDPKHFPNPKKFDPLRHINEQGIFEPDPKVVPFGLGRRRCLGEALAKMSLYMFLTGLVSQFDLKKKNEMEDIDGGEIIQGRLVDSIMPVTVRFVARK